MTWYLSGVANPDLDAVAEQRADMHDLQLGLLLVPGTVSYARRQHIYPRMAIDNSCFSAKGQAVFTDERYERLVKTCLDAWGSDCVLFAAAPDVPMQWAETLERSLPYLERIRRWGAPCALVLQDGASVDSVPWDALDAVFVGGSTPWKLGSAAQRLVKEALRRSKWAHMGRVNSARRLRVARDWGCDSADGTFLRFRRGPAGVAVVTSWLEPVASDGGQG